MDVFDRIPSYYDSLVERYGHDARAADYGGPESQHVKFGVLADVLSLKGRRVLDVGCGFADWADYLTNRYGEVEYTGVDLSPKMVAGAQARRPDLDIRLGNILTLDTAETFDVVTANGIFYLLGDDAWALMQRIVGRMFDLCTAAVAFSTLSSLAEHQVPDEFYAEPVATLEFCRTLTPWVVLRHDYHPRDFAVYMYRERQA